MERAANKDSADPFDYAARLEMDEARSVKTTTAYSAGKPMAAF
jgi:hypothetical protein